MDQDLSLLRYFLLITIVKLQNNDQYDQLKYRYIVQLRMNEMLRKNKKYQRMIILLKDIFLLRKSQLVTSYSLTLDRIPGVNILNMHATKWEKIKLIKKE
jgi:hypothetical protein